MPDQLPDITVQTTVNLAVDKVWKLWTTPADIMHWNNPSDEWHSPKVEVDLKDQGSFLFRMETKDGSAGFDHKGNYDKVISNELIKYTGSDGRKTTVTFTQDGSSTKVTETFQPESETPFEVQRDFCQSVLNNFKKYAEDKVS